MSVTPVAPPAAAARVLAVWHRLECWLAVVCFAFIAIILVLDVLGRDTGEMRLPMTPLEAAQKSALRNTLVAYGLLTEGRAVLGKARRRPAEGGDVAELAAGR